MKSLSLSTDPFTILELQHQSYGEFELLINRRSLYCEVLKLGKGRSGCVCVCVCVWRKKGQLVVQISLSFRSRIEPASEPTSQPHI